MTQDVPDAAAPVGAEDGDSAPLGIGAMSRFLGSNLGFSLGTISSSLAWFVLIPIAARTLTADDFGVIGLATSIAGLLAPAVSLNGAIFIGWHYSRLSAAERRDSITSVMATVAVLVLLLLAVTVAVPIGWLDIVQLPRPALVFAVLSAGLIGLSGIAEMVAQMQGRPRAYLTIRLASVAVATGATLLLLSLGYDWRARIVAVVAGGCVGGAVALLLLRNDRLLSRPRLAALRTVGRYGIPLLPHTAGVWLLGFADRFIISGTVGLDAAGRYSVAYAVGLALSALFDGGARTIAPKVENPATRQLGRTLSRQYALIALGVTAVAAVVAPPAIRWVLPAGLREAAAYLPILLAAQWFASNVRLLTAFFYAAGRTRARSATTVAMVVVNVLATVALVLTVGEVGAAWATLLTYAFGTALLVVLGRRFHLYGE